MLLLTRAVLCTRRGCTALPPRTPPAPPTTTRCSSTISLHWAVLTRLYWAFSRGTRQASALTAVLVHCG
eukprot:3052736-Rhodomonas_salina.2